MSDAAPELDVELCRRLEALARGVGIRSSGRLELLFEKDGSLSRWFAHVGPFGPAAVGRYEAAGAAAQEVESRRPA